MPSLKGAMQYNAPYQLPVQGTGDVALDLGMMRGSTHGSRSIFQTESVTKGVWGHEASALRAAGRVCLSEPGCDDPQVEMARNNRVLSSRARNVAESSSGLGRL